ncbi:MAG: AMP-binding protein [Bacteroidaceae bacterium]|nr:AMP-binding protein [Bacteroidaceae bacterium]
MTVSSAPVVIGKHVWIGEKASVFQGSVIGDGAIIGNSTVVSGEVSPRAMVAPVIDKEILSDVYWFYSEETKAAELRKYYGDVEPCAENGITSAPKEIYDKVCSVFSALGYDDSIFKGEDLIGSKVIDSLSLLSLIAELEEQFSVKIPIREVNGKGFYNVETIAALMDKLTTNKKSANTAETAEKQENSSAQAKKPLELHIEDTEKTVIQRIFENSVKTPDKVAIITENSETTYLELCKLIYSYSETYRRLGVKAGDNIVLQAIRDVRYIAAFYACHLLSAVPVPVEDEIGKERVVEIARETNAQLIICNYLNCGKKCISFEQLDDKTNIVSDIPIFSLNFPALNKPAQILFTTGTTGKSKGVVHSHSNTAHAAYCHAKTVEIKEDEVRGNSFPMNHTGAIFDLHMELANGQTFVAMPGWNDLNKVMSSIVDNKNSCLHCTPAALKVLLMMTESETIKNQLESVIIGSAPANKNTVDEFLRAFPNTELFSLYGCTECFPICFTKYKINEPVSLGYPCESVDVRLYEPEYNHSLGKEVGRIMVKSPCTMMGYYHDAEQTNAAFHDGYLTGADLGYFDENGALHFAGRADDVINVGGYKISPIETEAVAEESGLVQECILIKSFDKHNNEYLELLAVPKQPEFSSEALMNFIKDKVEAYRVPKKITVVGELKKTYNGKLDRKAYRS